MKGLNFHIFRILFLSILFLPLYSLGQDKEVNNIRISIKTGNSHGLSSLLNKAVELKTDNQNGTFSDTQAEFILKNFFRTHPPTNFEYNHIGSSPGGSKYMIGTYTSNSKTFRVYIKLKKIKTSFLIDNIDFTLQ